MGTPAQQEAMKKGPGFAKAQRDAQKAVKVGRSAVILAEMVKHELDADAPYGELALASAESRVTMAIERVTAEIEFNEQHGRKIADLLTTLTKGLEQQRKLREAREAATAARRHRARLPNGGQPVLPKRNPEHVVQVALTLIGQGAIPDPSPETKAHARALLASMAHDKAVKAAAKAEIEGLTTNPTEEKP